MKIVQVFLVSDHETHAETLNMTTWVDVHPGLKKDAIITLKDFPDVKWKVQMLYNYEHEGSDFDWHRKWDNNI